MNPSAVDATLEGQISQWREYLRRRAAIHGSDVAELEDHLRSQVATLMESGLAEDEAFLVAVKRMGNLDALSREFAREHSERLWKQLVMAPADDDRSQSWHRDALVAFLLALAAAIAVKTPAVFGLHIDHDAPFYARNASLFVFPLLTVYFAWKRRLDFITGTWLALGFAAGALFVNVYPFAPRSDTQGLSALHLPIALWLLVGFAYVGGPWFASERRMDFVRFSGEQFIYYVLIALGGGVLTAFTLMIFEAIHVRAEWFVGLWLVPCGAAAGVVVAAWLVEAKQSVIESMAPVLTRLFTPLFTLVLLVFIVAMLWTGKPIDVGRDVLIGFDLLLALVVALVLYAASSRDRQAPPNLFDGLQLLLIGSAIVVDALALIAIAARISELGFTPNRVAALGENLLLLANLAGAAWFYARFLCGRADFGALERWLIAYLPVYCLWAAFVVVGFPPMFDFG
ncbi:MAG TPA: permease prefix domain 1-containing protein [Steroidobacteraceae bacterium]|nr:permease prefix domain 1-containing protein [Steroidobacteraceae bacterium]